jgi:hypothetical protein
MKHFALIVLLSILFGVIFTSNTNNTIVSGATSLEANPNQETLVPTQITIFDNETLTPGQKIGSGIIDIRKYSGMSIFLSANNNQTSEGSGITSGNCYYLPDGEFANFRYSRFYFGTESTVEVPQTMTSDILLGGPNLVCDITNDRYGSTEVSLILYLMP